MRTLSNLILVITALSGLSAQAQTKAQPQLAQSIQQKAQPKLTQSLLSPSTVEKLMRLELWSQEAFEQNPNHVLNRATMEFILALQNPQISANAVAELLFQLGPCQSNGTAILVTECKLYTTKIIIFRDLALQLSPERKADLEHAFVKKYFDLTLDLVLHSKFKPIQVIAQRMRSLMNANAIRLLDLNEQAKASLPRNQHLDPSKVTGVYIPQLKALGVDLSKGISENAITLSHEMVHAADPVLADLQLQMHNLYPRLLARIGQSLETPNAAKVLVNSLLVDAYYEVRGDFYTTYVLNSLNSVTEKLEKSKLVASDPDLARDEVVKEWTRLLVKITVENEFRAHIYSAAIYYQLAETQRLIGTNREMVNFSRFLMANPVGFAINRGRLVDPFSKELQLGRIENEVRGAIAQDEPSFIDSKTNTISMRFKNQLNAVKSILQLHYLTELRDETQQYSSRYAAEIEYIRVRQESADAVDQKLSFLPDYVREGYRADKVDAYTVLSAQVGSAVILRFKQAVGHLNQDIDVFMSQLMTMKAKILDLSGLSFGELKLLGLQSSNSNSSGAALAGPSANQDLGAEQQAYLKFFNLQTWNTNEYLQQPIIEQNDLQGAVYRLRLLKFLSWFETKFPFGRDNLISTRIIHDRLRDGQYDKSEIDETRAAELMTEALEASRQASVAGASVAQIQYLFNSLSAVYELGILPEGADWNTVVTRFNQRMQFEQNLLQENGIDFTFNAQQFETEFTSSLAAVKERVRKNSASTCKDLNAGSINLISTLGTFRLNQVPISNVIALCTNKNIYLVRKSDSRTNSAPSGIENGKLKTQISFTSRYSYLNPFVEFGSRLSDLWR